MESPQQQMRVIDVNTNGDAPTPSTPASSVSSSLPKSQFSPEARDFLRKLDNYIPVGCLVDYKQSECTTSNDREAEEDWQEVSDPSSVLHRSEYFLQDLQALIVHGWIRLFTAWAKPILRVYVLPGDVGHRYVDRSHKLLARALHALVKELDVSPDTWDGHPGTPLDFDSSAALDEGSLHFMFNTLPSPSPSISSVKSYFHRQALKQLLDESSPLPGLRTQLYPYQRRSAGLMLQRESERKLELDPRLEQRIAPDGSVYYYGPRTIAFLKSPRYYESSKGGILAETMGLGKTLMCIALVLSTKGYLPKVPVQYGSVTKRPEVGNLTEMAIAAIHQHSAPWRAFFEQITAATGEHMTECMKLLQQNSPTYEIPMEPIRWNRKTSTPPPKVLALAPTTLIVVPRNLFSQWKSELDKHIEFGSLNMLFMDDPKKALPSPKDLVLYDLILFSRPRFELEVRDGSDSKGRRKSRYPVSCNCPYIGATRDRDCTCLRDEDLYDSPLKHIHFLRVIIDEGHFFTSSRTKAAEVANAIVRADHRWVVTGTPAKDLLGTEMNITVESESAAPNEAQRQEALLQRKKFNVFEDTGGATKSIGNLVSHFLKVRPWTACENEPSADWRQEIFRQEESIGKSVIVGFSRCLRQTLEAVVIKTRPEDVERDINLPPLEHHATFLEPSYYDKLTANTFAFVLAANAVTSERTDTDYLFHANSRKERNTLVHNLRASAFAWTGFSEEDIDATISNCEGYLKKDNVTCSDEDRTLLERCIKQARSMTASPSWRALSKSHEIGLFVDSWPAESAQFWSFDQSPTFSPFEPLLCGVTQLLKAQAHVNERIDLQDPSEGLSGAGIRHLSIIRSSATNSTALVKSGIPSSSVKEQPLHHRLAGATERSQPAKSATTRPAVKSEARNVAWVNDEQSPFEVPDTLSLSSPLRHTRIIGSTSAKLSYLLSGIEEQHRTEKILIFYDDDNTAYYIAQALEMMHCSHFIYAKSLTAAKKSEYIVQFDSDASYRVLLMDIGQAAFGLNVTSASRIYFLNPVCQPQIEAQAIKRAHRIGQTKKVVVETLVLKGTIEEQMFERARRMTRVEHIEAKVLDDDRGITQILQSVRPMHISEIQRRGVKQIALLAKPQQLWCRENWPQWKLMQEEKQGSRKPSKRKASETGDRRLPQKRPNSNAGGVTFVDVTNPLEAEILMQARCEPGTPLQARGDHRWEEGLREAFSTRGEV